MATKVQIVFDCRDPDALAKFYAEALRYEIQDPPTGYKSWEEFLKSQGVPENEWDSASAIVDPEGKGPRIYFQKMDTPKLGKNRLHLDLNASGGHKVPIEERKKQVREEVERLLKLGATRPREREEQGEFFVGMLDLEGNEFDVQ